MELNDGTWLFCSFSCCVIIWRDITNEGHSIKAIGVKATDFFMLFQYSSRITLVITTAGDARSWQRNEMISSPFTAAFLTYRRHLSISALLKLSQICFNLRILLANSGGSGLCGAIFNGTPW